MSCTGVDEMPRRVDKRVDDGLARRASAVSLPRGESVSTPYRHEAAANSYERVLRIRPDDPHVQSIDRTGRNRSADALHRRGLEAIKAPLDVSRTRTRASGATTRSSTIRGLLTIANESTLGGLLSPTVGPERASARHAEARVASGRHRSRGVAGLLTRRCAPDPSAPHSADGVQPV
jgi:hypothetical protein